MNLERATVAQLSASVQLGGVAQIAAQMESVCKSRSTAELVGPLLSEDVANVVLQWVTSVASRRDLVIAPLLAALPRANPAALREAATARVLAGPLYDALHCVPLCWGEPRIGRRLSQLVWEAGARGMVLPALGRWVWAHESALEALVLHRATGHAGDRVVAARALAIFADGFVEEAAPGRTRIVIATLRALLEHPEPLVWTAAARALGRLAAHSYSARHAIQQAPTTASLRQRRRIAAAVASMPVAVRGDGWQAEIDRWFAADARDPWQLAAFAIGTPHLAREQPALWQLLCDRAVASGNLELAWSLADGLAALARHGGNGSRELRAARALHDRLVATPQSGAHEEARRIDALGKLAVALGEEPALLTCFDAYDRDLAMQFSDHDDDRARDHADGSATHELPSPRAAFGDAIALLVASTQTPSRARALLAIEGAARAYALHLPTLVLGSPVRENDGRELFNCCEQLLRDSTEYAVRTAVVNVLCDLVAAHDRHDRHGQVAARALVAIATSRWANEVTTDEAAFRESVRRSRKHFEDLFSVCLGSYDQLAFAAADGVALPLVVWWALCAGPARLLVPLHRDKTAAAALASKIAELEAALDAATKPPVSAWRGRLRAALLAFDIEGTTIFEVVERLVDALEQAEKTPRDHEHAVGKLAKLAAACEGMLAIAHDLDEAFVTGAALPVGEISTRKLRAIKTTPWEQLGTALRCIVEPVARRLAQRAKDTEPFRPRAGERLGRFELVERLGIGGMGQVWKAREGSRLVALKFPRHQQNPEVTRALGSLLMREAETLESLSFACVALLIDAGIERDVPYLAVEFIRGVTLEQYLIDDPAAAPAITHIDIVRRVFEDVCIGLDNLHRHGFVHRDLKPANIMLRMRGRDGDPILPVAQDPHGDEIDESVLVDFGIAHAFDTHGAGCTLGYAAPELLANGLVGPAADAYSLGASLYHLFTKQTLLGPRVDDREAAMRWHLMNDVRDQRVRALVDVIPAPWRAIVEGTCLLEPADRLSLAQIRRLVRNAR